MKEVERKRLEDQWHTVGGRSGGKEVGREENCHQCL